jgi:hypothetical protein
MKNFYSNLKKLMPVAILAIVFSMLASCSSSNQFASSFSKRKYMTGHYSDPIAKVKVEARNAVNIASSDIKEAVSESKITLNKEDGKISESNTTANQKLSNYKAVQPVLASKHSSQKSVTNGLAAANGKKNVSTIEQNSSTTSSPDSVEKTAGEGGHHHYLGLFFLCLLLGLIFLLLAAVSVVGGSAAGLGLFAILAYIMWIAAIVFLVLWIISLI